MANNDNRATIFVGTMTGLADMCGEEIELALQDAGFECDRMLMDGLTVSSFEDCGLIVIVTSTYGQGEIPDNGMELFASVEAGADLKGCRYVIFALGDRTYADTYCAAGDRFDKALTACGATRVVEVQRHDASSGTLAEDVAGEWAAGWANKIAAGE